MFLNFVVYRLISNKHYEKTGFNLPVLGEWFIDGLLPIRTIPLHTT